MYRRGRRWYERIWPKCTAAGRRVVAVDATPACGYREVRLATSSAAIGEDLVTREYARATHLYGGACLAIGHAAALTIDRHYAQIFKDATVLELGIGCGPGALLGAPALRRETAPGETAPGEAVSGAAAPGTAAPGARSPRW